MKCSGSKDEVRPSRGQTHVLCGMCNQQVLVEEYEHPRYGPSFMLQKHFPKILGTLGDINPIDHGGGVVYLQDGHPQIVYFAPFEDQVSIYHVTIDTDETTNCDWADLDAVASYTGIDVQELRSTGSHPDPHVRAFFLEGLAGYYGWGELTAGYSETLSREAAEERYGEFCDQA